MHALRSPRTQPVMRQPSINKYDDAIKNWRIELDEAFPLSTNEIVQTYKAKIQ
jgi:hypothetical protein